MPVRIIGWERPHGMLDVMRRQSSNGGGQRRKGTAARCGSWVRCTKGLGVVQDYVEAHMWFNLASSRGDAVALRERDALRGKMTSEQLALAQKRAREWGSPRKRLRVPPKLARKLKTGVPAGSSKAEAQRVMSRKLSKVAALVTKGDISLEKMLSARSVNVNVRDRDGRG